MLGHIKLILFLLGSLGLGIGIGWGYLLWKNHPRADFSHAGEKLPLTGIGDAPSRRGFVVADPAQLPALLGAAEQAFATAVGIQYSTALTREKLGTAVRQIHERQMRAALLPAPAFTGRNPYPAPLRQIAADAQAAGIDYLCISWLNETPDQDFWTTESAAVRAAFKGQVIFAGTPAALTSMSCWEAGDIYGAIGPLRVPRRLPDAKETVKPHDLRVAWAAPLTTLEYLARAHGRKMALLNMNIPLEVSARLPNPDSEDRPPPNPALQKMLYEALLLETKGRSENTEMLLFNWGRPGDTAAPNNVSGLMEKVGEAWDPKKPRMPESLPATLDDEPDPDAAASRDAL